MAEQKIRGGDALAGFGADLLDAGFGFDEAISGAEQDARYAHIDSLPKTQVDQIHPDPNQPRSTQPFAVLFEMRPRDLRALLDATEETDDAFKAEHPRAHEVVELARSIRAHGLQQPLYLRPRAQGGHYIVYGERRWTAINALVRAGYADYRDVPFLEDSRDLTRAEWLALQIAEDWHKSKHSVIDTIASIRRIADEKAGGDLMEVPATEIAEALQIHYKAAQRYLRVAKALESTEIQLIRSVHPEVDLSPLLKLVEWIGEQEQAGGMGDENRARALQRFAEVQPRAGAVRVALAEFASRKKTRGPGRPTKARYEAVVNRSEGINAYVRVPVGKLTPDSVARARKRLEEALEKISRLETELFG